jgi:DNA (cytosine-5)-methyltransferase 1
MHTLNPYKHLRPAKTYLANCIIWIFSMVLHLVHPLVWLEIARKIGEKKFREGQAEQVLDNLFFDFIDLAKELQPKIVVAENVKGLLLGSAKDYVIRIYKAFDEAGYYCQHFLLNASKMGVPQKRERVFFICLRKDLSTQFLHMEDMFTEIPKITMEFNEKEIPFKEIYDGKGLPITEYKLQAWKHRKPTDSGISDSKQNAGMKVSDFNHVYLKMDKVMPTITGKAEHAMSLYDEPIKPSETELKKGGSYPLDYKYNNIGYLIGMSVPPVMTAQIASNIYEQWLSKL